MSTKIRNRGSRSLQPALRHGAILAGALCLVIGGARADEGEKRLMTDAELDQVTAGNVAVSETDDTIVFEAVKETAAGRTIKADGSLKVLEIPSGITLGTLSLSDGAQQNLQSLININAVNSAVNVLLNLNVTIDSSVGTINQQNFTEALPHVPPLPLGN